MAGSYPDAPSRRLAYDDDGTVVLWNGLTVIDANEDAAVGQVPLLPLIAMPQAQIDQINDEETTSPTESGQNNNASSWILMMFLQKMEIDGGYYNINPTHTGNAQWMAFSTNTTNGIDGSFADLSVTTPKNTTVADDYRDDITSMAESNVVCVTSFQGSDERFRWRQLHVYGAHTPGETPDKLIFLDPDNADNEFTKPLDFGDVPRGQTQKDTFKIKNNSSSLTANTVNLINEDLFGGASSWYTYSTDDISFSSSEDLGNIGNGGTQLVFIKQIVPDAQVVGVYASRTRATVASWS